MMNDYEKGGELNELAQKHDSYADELEKIKQMLMWTFFVTYKV